MKSDYLSVMKHNYHRGLRIQFLVWFTHVISDSYCLIPPSNKVILLAVRRTIKYKFFLETRINKTNAVNYVLTFPL